VFGHGTAGRRRATRKLPWVFLAAACVLLCNCSDDQSIDGKDAAIALDSIAEAYAKVVCAHLERCPTVTFAGARFSSQAACLKAMTPAFDYWLADDMNDVAERTRTYDSDALGACLQAMRKLPPLYSELMLKLHPHPRQATRISQQGRSSP